MLRFLFTLVFCMAITGASAQRDTARRDSLLLPGSTFSLTSDSAQTENQKPTPLRIALVAAGMGGLALLVYVLFNARSKD